MAPCRQPFHKLLLFAVQLFSRRPPTAQGLEEPDPRVHVTQVEGIACLSRELGPQYRYLLRAVRIAEPGIQVRQVGAHLGGEARVCLLEACQLQRLFQQLLPALQVVQARLDIAEHRARLGLQKRDRRAAPPSAGHAQRRPDPRSAGQGRSVHVGQLKQHFGRPGLSCSSSSARPRSNASRGVRDRLQPPQGPAQAPGTRRPPRASLLPSATVPPQSGGPQLHERTHRLAWPPRQVAKAPAPGARAAYRPGRGGARPRTGPSPQRSPTSSALARLRLAHISRLAPRRRRRRNERRDPPADASHRPVRCASSASPIAACS